MKYFYVAISIIKVLKRADQVTVTMDDWFSS